MPYHNGNTLRAIPTFRPAGMAFGPSPMDRLVTGFIDIINGVGLLTFAGAHLGSVASDPVLNSQIGFWGAIWFGFGIILWRASSHLRDEVALFRLLCGTIALSGPARLGSALAYGLPGPARCSQLQCRSSSSQG